MSRKKMILKLLTVIVGTVIAAFGLDIAIYAGFGSATLAVLWQGMAKTIRITIGQASLIIASAMVVFTDFHKHISQHLWDWNISYARIRLWLLYARNVFYNGS